MTTLPFGPRAAARAVLLLMVLFVPAAAAQPFGEGTHAFRAVLNQAGLKPLRSIAEVDRDPAHSIIIVLGRTEAYDDILCDPNFGLRRFLPAGGAVLIASDRRTSDPMFLETGVTIGGIFVGGPADQCYRERFEQCPVLVPRPLPATDPAAGLFAGLSQGVFTNRPSFITAYGSPFGSPAPLAILASLPRGCFIETPSGDKRTLFGVPFTMPFAVGGNVGAGRLLVLADHSLFINDMMLQPDNDNIPFAMNVARWLADNKRTAALFIEDGQVRTDFDVSLNLTEPPLPPIEALIPLADQALLALEREDLFNKALLRSFGRGTLLRTLLLVVTLGLLAYGLYAVTRARFRTDPQLPRNPAPAAHAATALALDRRQAAQLRAGDLAEAARELARQTLADLGASPHVTVTGSWWRQRAWGRRLRDLERIAAEGPAQRIAPRRLVRLAAGWDDLRRAVAVGAVRFEGPGRSA